MLGIARLCNHHSYKLSSFELFLSLWLKYKSTSSIQVQNINLTNNRTPLINSQWLQKYKYLGGRSAKLSIPPPADLKWNRPYLKCGYIIYNIYNIAFGKDACYQFCSLHIIILTLKGLCEKYLH